MAEEETPSIHDEPTEAESAPGVPTTRKDDEGKEVLTEH